MAKTEIDVIIKGKDKASGVLGKIGKLSKGIAVGAAGIATAAAGMGIAAVKSFADAGDEVQKMALRTGFSTEALSELKHAAELSGSSLGGMETGFKKMARFVGDAREGLSTSTDVLDNLGLSVEDLKGLSPEEAFNTLSTAVAGLGDPLAQQHAAMEVFGKAGTAMLPMLAQGAEGIAEMRQEAHDLGIVFDQEAADKAAGFKDNITRLQGAFSGLMNELGQALMPVLDALIPLLIDVVKALPIDEIAELVRTLLPPLVDLFLELWKSLPFDLLVKFVQKAMGPLMKLMGGLMSILNPLIQLLEPVFDILLLILDILDPVIDAIVWIMDMVGGVLGKYVETIGKVVKGIVGFFGGGDDEEEEKKKKKKGGTEAAAEYAPPPERETSPPEPVPLWTPAASPVFDPATAANYSRMQAGRTEVGLQGGGIVTSPTRALIGEAGPEAVIPLRHAGLGDVFNITVQGSVWAMEDLVSQLRVEFLKIKADNTTTGF